MRNRTRAVIGAAAVMMALPAYAEDYLITIKDRQFVPKEFTIPKDTKVKITVKNLDNVPAEFESHELNREKVIAPGGQATVFVGPLAAGNYPFFDEFNDKNTGAVVVK